MPKGAPRLAFRCWPRAARGARQMLRVLLASMLCAAPSLADVITGARYAAPTDRYAHGILGDAIEWGALELTLDSGQTVTFTLPQDHVFEDVAPRLADLDQDGHPEVVVVETDTSRGGALAIYGTKGKITETPHIGTRNRWLAPLGAADLDGDGTVELAYIDRPHLAKTLRLWRYDDQKLTPVADLPGLTNHRIGERDIAGGIRLCDGAPEMILASANWSELRGVRWDGRRFTTERLGSNTSRAAFANAMACAE
ncbi:FG-GAP repeat domain-containing protein [Tateyamaria sp.]|uniref:FG-GAP repeat domain-containing protein n=1 Tax=Tateyamaria sp. TaxID=1929288 RepID=UPI003B2160EC